MSTLARRVFIVLAALLLLAGVPAAPSGATTPGSLTLTGIDLHDGMVIQSGGTFYLYGTEYACGFTWRSSGTPFCGFGVSTAPSLAGPWTAPTTLFSPSDIDPFTGTNWNTECGATGAGCFNPRMIVRTGWGPDDGVPILWFNAPADWARSRANAYYAMGCNSLTGPCGAAAGAPHGSTTKPSLSSCYDNGDFTLVPNNPNPPTMLCTMADQSLASEQITVWGTGGTGGSHNLAGLTNVEAPGAYQLPSGMWVMTYSDPNCGYCGGDGTGYATASSLAGPWTAPSNPGVAAPATGRRDLSATSCGGQPRTVSLLDGQPYQGIDLWTGSLNEASAGLHFEPLTYTGQTTPTWSPFTPWPCS